MIEGKVCVVTGAATGIGAAIATLFGRHGGHVVVDHLKGQEHEAAAVVHAVKEGGGTGLAVVADVADENGVEALFDRALDWGGHIDVLINNAGIGLRRPLDMTEPADWDRVLSVNLRSQFLCCRRAAKHMVEAGAGRIINLSSGVVKLALVDHVAYCSSKYGIVGLTRSLALELAPHGVLVNAIAPGAVDTPINTDNYTPVVRAGLEERIPLGRIARPEDIAGAALFLSSPLADYICGQTIFVDGGLNVNGSVGQP